MGKTVTIDDKSEPGSWAEATRKPRQRHDRFVAHLPFPPKKLSRNGSQGDYRGKADSAKDYRRDCLTACREATGSVDWCPDLPVMLEMTFHGPDKRHRDLDNLLAMTKQGIDAISEYIGIDDKHFEFTIRRGEARKPSVVVVTI